MMYNVYFRIDESEQEKKSFLALYEMNGMIWATMEIQFHPLPIRH